MEGFLDLKIPIWARVSFTRIVAIGPGILVAILTEGMYSHAQPADIRQLHEADIQPPSA